MSEEISNSGLFFDEYYALRVLEPSVADDTTDLNDECVSYVDKLREFQTISERFVTITDSIAKRVDVAKMRAIGAQTLLKSKVSQRETEQKELQLQLLERNMQLERLKVELHTLQRIEADQQEVIDNFLQTN